MDNTKHLQKYPRTPHVPWSEGASEDDIFSNIEPLIGKKIVVTEKMDGENTTMYPDYIHARSLDSANHPSRNRVKSIWGEIRHHIPENWRICGENVYAKHSIQYNDLLDYFLVFSIWEGNKCLSWDDTVSYSSILHLNTVPVLYSGIFDVKYIKNLVIDKERQEGYVIRLAESFYFEDFNKSIAKYVRKGHVQTDEHWMKSEIIPNKLRDI